MKNKNNTNRKMRKIHRYLGFFLVGIMTVYSVSGIALIFRKTDIFKKYVPIEKTVDTHLSEKELARALKIRELHFKEPMDLDDKNSIQHLSSNNYIRIGTYNPKTGDVKYIAKKTPYLLGKMFHLHKAKDSDPLFFLNIFFGLSLFFYVVSSFWMFVPSTATFKKGMYFVGAGIVLTLILLFF